MSEIDVIPKENELDVWGRHLLNKVYASDAPIHFKYYGYALDGLVGLTQRNQDAMVAVTGTKRGIGKTTFAFDSSLINRQRGVGFEWENSCTSIDSLPDVVSKSLKQRSNSYIIDEAIDVADARDFASKINKDLTKAMTKVRKRNNIYYWCIPDFMDLDSRLRNRIIDYWIFVFEQSDGGERDRRYASAALFKKDLNPFNSDKWGIGDAKKFAIQDTDRLRKYLKKCRSYVGEISFPILPKPIEDKYTVMSNAALDATADKFVKDHSKPAGVPSA